MSLKLYDDAITKKIQSWTQNTDLKIYSPGDTKMLFQVLSDTKEDAPIELPIVSISRQGGMKVEVENKQTLSYDGLTLDANIENSVLLNAIPIQLQYQVDIYTRFAEEADLIVRNIIFNIVNFPILRVFLQYNEKEIEHHSTLHLSENVEDNSDIQERFVKGEFTRYTLDITVADAYLWDVRTRSNWTVDGEVTEI